MPSNNHQEQENAREQYIELRVSYPGHPYVALIDGLDVRCDLNRVWIGDWLYHHRDFLPDGRQEQVYRLLQVDAIYEVGEKRDGRRTCRYVATRDGDPTLYSILRHEVEAVASKKTTVSELIRRKYPDEAFHEEPIL